MIGPQDVLTIQVYDQADLGGRYSVEADGTFGFPLIGRVKAGGLTLRSLEQQLKAKLVDGYFRNPQVTVAIEQDPQPARLRHGRSATARAGSVDGWDDPHRSARPRRLHDLHGVGRSRDRPHLTRGRARSGVTGPDRQRSVSRLDPGSRGGALSQNLELRDGDTMFVPRAETVYVFGQVRTPGAYGVQQNMTVLQALSLAGGVTEHGAMGRVRVVRTEKGAKKEIKVKLTDLVRAGDTLIIPERFF